MKTSRPVKRKKTAIETIHWKKVLLIPFIVVSIVGLLFGSLYILNTNSLKSLEERISKQQQELQDYLKNNEGKMKIQKILRESAEFVSHYDYEAALHLLTLDDTIQGDPQIIEMLKVYKDAQKSLVSYKAEVPVVFTHILINKPKLAFNSGYDILYITNYEFKSIIQQMYDRGYVLVSFDDVYAFDGKTWVQKELLLPKNKKPFILNIDENAYDGEKPLVGFARGLTIREGEFVSRILTSNDVDLTKGDDAIPILEEFLVEHPDFSYHGARGILPLTGFAGVFGYRLMNQIEINDAKSLIALLKEKGWSFACTSFDDSDNTYVFNPSSSSIAADLKKWKDTLHPYVGDTSIFVSPYGNLLSGSSLQAVISAGYNVYFYDSSKPTVNIREGVLYISRVAFTGENLRISKNYLETNFFDVDTVLDPAR